MRRRAVQPAARTKRPQGRLSMKQQVDVRRDIKQNYRDLRRCRREDGSEGQGVRRDRRDERGRHERGNLGDGSTKPPNDHRRQEQEQNKVGVRCSVVWAI